MAEPVYIPVPEVAHIPFTIDLMESMEDRWSPPVRWRAVRDSTGDWSIEIRGLSSVPEDDPAPAGVEHQVSSRPEWDAAVAAARPGDVIRLKASMEGPLVVPPLAITVTADPGVWIGPEAGDG